ncbi:MAG: KTSC domain-containing protein [Chloroflexota bacterium]|jgi:hypothetical protein
MQQTPLNSSNLRAVGYDPATRTLEIEFQNGHIYQYSGVPPSSYKALMAAESHGRYFNGYIRGAFPCRQVR